MTAWEVFGGGGEAVTWPVSGFTLSPNNAGAPPICGVYLRGVSTLFAGRLNVPASGGRMRGGGQRVVRGQIDRAGERLRRRPATHHVEIVAFAGFPGKRISHGRNS